MLFLLHVLYFCFQARRLICDQLACVLGFRPVPQPANTDESSGENHIKNRHHSDGDLDQTTAKNDRSNSDVLTGILGLLETRISIDDEDRLKADRDAKMRRDWMTAAAVIDRVAFILLIVAFTVGTLVFVVLLM